MFNVANLIESKRARDVMTSPVVNVGPDDTARAAAEAMLRLRGGRAINLPKPDWPGSLRGKAADFFLRRDKELRPLGFALSVRIASFPNDADLSLVWAASAAAVRLNAGGASC